MSRQNLGVVRDPKFAARYSRDPNNPYYNLPYRKPSSFRTAQPNQRSGPEKWTTPGFSVGQGRRDLVDGVGGSLTAIAGAAAVLNSAAIPVAAGLGIGYGVYKLGETFKLW